jgi:hypothetical protein
VTRHLDGAAGGLTGDGSGDGTALKKESLRPERRVSIKASSSSDECVAGGIAGVVVMVVRVGAGTRIYKNTRSRGRDAFVVLYYIVSLPKAEYTTVEPPDSLP